MNRRKFLTSIVAASAIFATSGASALSLGSTGSDEIKYLNAGGSKFQHIHGSAGKTGSYYKAGSKLMMGLKQSVNADTDGSWDNMDLLAKGIINSAWVQADVYNLWLSKKPAYKSSLLASHTGRLEHIQLVMREGMDEDDLQSEKAKIYVGSPASGGAGSWRNMCLLESGYAKASVETGTYKATSSIALSKLKSGEFDAVILTSHIDVKDSFVAKVNADKSIHFANVDDRNLNNDIKIGGKDTPIYEFVTVDVAKGFFNDTEIKTIATEVLLVVNTKLMNNDQLANILDALDLKKSGMFR